EVIMSKLKIIKAANKKGFKFDDIYFGSEPTPGESVRCWSIYVSEETQEKISIDCFIQFSNTTEALEWIEELDSVPGDKPKEAQPSDTEMLDWLIEVNSKYIEQIPKRILSIS